MTVAKLIEELIDFELAGYGNYRVMCFNDSGSPQELEDREVFVDKDEVLVY